MLGISVRANSRINTGKYSHGGRKGWGHPNYRTDRGGRHGPHHGALNLTSPLDGIYRVTSQDKSKIASGLAAVFAYSFGMIGYGLYQMVQACRRGGCMGLTSLIGQVAALVSSSDMASP